MQAVQPLVDQWNITSSDVFDSVSFQTSMFWSLLTGYLAISSVLAQSADDYIASELPIAKAGLLANIGPDGEKSSGALAGVVIASPSSESPDYLYTWTRDSALVFQTVIDLLVD
jgi:glucoamylase